MEGSVENVEYHYKLGNGLMVQRRFAEATVHYEQVLRLRPDFVEAYNNLGVALAELGDLTAAMDRYREALHLRPDFAEAHYDLGNALRDLGLFDEAASSYQQALRLRPDWPEVWTNLGLACFAQGKFEQATESHERALRLRADFVEAHNNLGIALQIQGKLDKALPHFDQAIELQPHFALAHCNRALGWLLLGDFARGWPEYEWRWNVPGFPALPSGVSLWDGSPLTGKTILLYAEQGFGDSLQFIRYARLVQGRGGRVVVFCRPELSRILATSPGVDEVAVERCDLPTVDVQAALMSLPRIFQTLLTSVPVEVPYLFSDASLEAAWGREISGIRAFKIGIVWQGSRSHINDRQRSIPLALFSPLSRLSGVQLFSLQKGGCEQIGHPAEEMALIDLGSKLYDFMDTAAAVKNLDLIITVDTSIAHLAGGLGAPVWVALPFSAEWRWLLHREDSPWYPTMRLFRQTRPGEWGDVFRRMVTELSRILTDRPVATSRRTARMPRNPQTYSSERSGLYTRRRREGRL